jgi:DNA-binding response OmpR family regulator
VEGKVLIVEPSNPVRRALEHVFTRRGYSVVVADGATAATRLPARFDCGVFSDQLTDGNALTLAGWFLAEQRVNCVVFFGISEDVEVRLRACNLGSYVSRNEGLHRLERAVAESLACHTRIRRVANGEGYDAYQVTCDSSTSESGLRRR